MATSISGKNFIVSQCLNSRFNISVQCKGVGEVLRLTDKLISLFDEASYELVRNDYKKIIDAYACIGIIKLNNDAHSAHIIFISGCVSMGKIGTGEVFRITATTFVCLSNGTTNHDSINDVRLLLNSGTFYYTTSIDKSLDITRSVAVKQTDDNIFFWNKNHHTYFTMQGVIAADWLVKMICGGVEIRTIYAGQRQAKACLISRLSCKRAGTRFNVRGVNDQGHVANFVETDQIIFIDQQIACYTQLRGSVPLFWDQPGFQVGSHRVRMTRGFEATVPAFRRHIQMLKHTYTSTHMAFINLLGNKEGESTLTQIYHNHFVSCPQVKPFSYISFDYHSECKDSNSKNLHKLYTSVEPLISRGQFYYEDTGTVYCEQKSFTRINCIDCLDRTNSVQTMLAMKVLPQLLEKLQLNTKESVVRRISDVYRQMWQLNGDHISRMYAGTGALGSRSKMGDAARSATRTIQNNFLDVSKQEAIDKFLFSYPLSDLALEKSTSLNCLFSSFVSDKLTQALIEDHSSFTRTHQLRIAVGTWNVNGGKTFQSIAHKQEKITDWLLDLGYNMKMNESENVLGDVDYTQPVDIFSIGFQEIVELNTQNIMNASQENQLEWSSYLTKHLTRDNDYILLTSAQLVGVCLFIFVRPHLIEHIRDVGIESVKTGLGGSMGNKGAIALRFRVYASSFCFVCSHFAAGQSQVKERNANYNETTKKVNFQVNLLSHDYVFWCGDFNYRIDLPRAEVKQCIIDNDYATLIDNDQLTQQRKADAVFKDFQEGELTFAPTYKYDILTDDYDTSEKCRCPAWTDRVLWKSQGYPSNDAVNMHKVQQLLYSRAELKTSDHRPVLALFDVIALQPSYHRMLASLQRNLSISHGPLDCSVLITLDNDFTLLTDDNVESIMNLMSALGDAIAFVRFYESGLLLTFEKSETSLEALAYDQFKSPNGHIMSVRILEPDWISRVMSIFESLAIIENEQEVTSEDNSSIMDKISSDLDALQHSENMSRSQSIASSNSHCLFSGSHDVANSCSLDDMLSMTEVSQVSLCHSKLMPLTPNSSANNLSAIDDAKTSPTPSNSSIVVHGVTLPSGPPPPIPSRNSGKYKLATIN